MSIGLRSLILLAAGAITCSFSCAQSLAVGVIGGVRGTDDLTGGAANSVSKRYAFGPQANIGLPFGFGIEVDALYRRQGYQAGAFYSGEFDEHANSWEFPMLLKYRLRFPLVKPFLEAGYAPRVIHGTEHYYTNGTSVSTGYPASQGIVVGGGVEVAIGRLRLSPAVRYTRWNNAPIMVYFGDGPEALSSQNQLDILLGVAWKIH
jgi:hypothetical protein